MGGSESVGHLYIQVENPNVQAGQELTGVIHFKLDSDITADSLLLNFHGNESCMWTEGDGEDSSTYTGSAAIIKQHFQVFVFADSRVAAGHYSFPFAFTTPPNLLGSFQLSLKRGSASIQYFLTASIQSQSKIPNSKTEVHVTRLLTESIVPVSGLNIARITTCCCFSKGSVQLRTFVDKSAYMPGEVASVEAEVDNSESGLDILYLTCSLLRTIRLNNGAEHTFITKKSINEVNLDEYVPAWEKLNGEKRLKLSLPIGDGNEELQNATTVNGKVIQCAYAVSLKAETTGCCVHTPEVDRELLIYPLQQPMAQPPPIPENWHPIIMPVAQLQHQPGYQPSAPPLPSQI